MVRERKDLLKRCYHIGDVGLVPGSVFIPTRSKGYDHCQQIVGMIDRISWVRLHTLLPVIEGGSVLCNSLVERPQSLGAEPAPALTPVLAPLVMRR